MKRLLRHRRFILFSAAALVVLSGLTTAMVISVKNQFKTDEWTDYLGANELATFQGVVNPQSEDPAADANLQIPGMNIEPGICMRNQKDEPYIVYEAQLDARLHDARPLDIVADAWTRKGFQVQHLSDRIMAKIPNGDTYAASMNTRDASGVILTHFMSNDQSPLGAAGHKWPEKYAGLFPKIPDNLRVIEHGRPGFAGYSVMLNSPVSAVDSFKIFTGEMEKRGWEPLDENIAAAYQKASYEKLSSMGTLAITYRHKQAPFGCQLVVSKNTDTFEASHVMLSLF